MTPHLKRIMEKEIEAYFEGDGPGYLGEKVYGDGFQSATDILLPLIEQSQLALEGLQKWAVANHQMPGYSEVIYNAEMALSKIKQTLEGE